jgi:hypothetical protein
MLENLFEFPIVMVDGDNEEKKIERNQSLALPGTEDEELDLIIGYAECPYYDFISVTDRWLPTAESLENAMNGKFDACYVVFGSSGSFVVPWNKKKFKERYIKFVEEYNANPANQAQIVTSREELQEIIDELPSKKNA